MRPKQSDFGGTETPHRESYQTVFFTATGSTSFLCHMMFAMPPKPAEKQSQQCSGRNEVMGYSQYLLVECAKYAL